MAPPEMPPPVSAPWDDDGPRILGAVLTITLLAFVSCMARAYVRIVIIRSPGWDDFTMAFSMVLSIAAVGVVVSSVHHGAGRHIGDVDPVIYGMGMKLNFVSQILYLWDILLVKLAVGAQLLRIATQPLYRGLILGVMGFMAVYTTGCFFTLVLQCTDIRIMWDPTVTSTCWPQPTVQALAFANVSLSIFTDLFFALIIPVPMLWNLNVNRRTRWTLIGIMGLGVFACAAAATKIPYIVDYGKTGDWLWDSRNLTIWTIIEANIGIIAGSLATLRPLFRTLLGGSTYDANSRKKTGGTGGSAAAAARASRSGVFKSGGSINKWQSLSSLRRGEGDVADETSSERAFNARNNDYYEMQHGHRGQSHTTVMTDLDRKSSEDISSRDERSPTSHGRNGIMRSTTTAVVVSRAS